MENNKELVNYLINKGVLITDSIIDAFKNIDRKDFVLQESLLFAYANAPLSIGYNQTISQPYTVAFMLELLGVKEGENVLDVGSGSGWTTTLLAYMVGEEGTVLGLELINELVDFGAKNLLKYNMPWAEIITSNEDFNFIDSEYEKILVSAASSGKIPRLLLEKLKIMGVMVIPVNDYIYKITKISENKIDIEKFHGFRFVPLIYNEI
ncbi:MAG: class I SAM-dependent methyltransferase [Candidatus Gracilibacteria bacterium]